MKYIGIIAIALLLSVNALSAKLMVKVEQAEFQEIAKGKTVVTKGPSNGTNFYVTDGNDGFYYWYGGPAGLYLPTSTVIRTENFIPEAKWIY